jgi:hypothetical protein
MRPVEVILIDEVPAVSSSKSPSLSDRVTEPDTSRLELESLAALLPLENTLPVDVILTKTPPSIVPEFQTIDPTDNVAADVPDNVVALFNVSFEIVVRVAGRVMITPDGTPVVSTSSEDVGTNEPVQVVASFQLTVPDSEGNGTRIAALTVHSKRTSTHETMMVVSMI